MRYAIERVADFHEAFGIKMRDIPSVSTPEEYELHYKLMLEELDEFHLACKNGNVVGIADGLADVLFVLFSSAIAHGLGEAIVPIFYEVCNSNMSKLREDGSVVRREDGKVMRSETYFPPKLEPIINQFIEAKKLADVKHQ